MYVIIIKYATVTVKQGHQHYDGILHKPTAVHHPLIQLTRLLHFSKQNIDDTSNQGTSTDAASRVQIVSGVLQNAATRGLGLKRCELCLGRADIFGPVSSSTLRYNHIPAFTRRFYAELLIRIAFLRTIHFAEAIQIKHQVGIEQPLTYKPRS